MVGTNDLAPPLAPAPIQILLGTHNYARYFDEFMESLLAQDFDGWTLLVRDDASSDETPTLLAKWQGRLGPRMAILPDSGRSNLGVAGNFSRLLAASTAPYVMFADQDDVWHPDKVRVTFDAMRRLETEHGSTLPCLVHTDLAIVDEHLKPVAPSLWRMQGLVPNRGHSLSRTLVENTVWACTTMLNRHLAELVGEIPKESHSHDWWIALVAASFGQVRSLPIQSIEWRRHGANDSETTRLVDVFLRAVKTPAAMRLRLKMLIDQGRPRARIFLSRYRHRLTPDQIAAVEAYLQLSNMRWFARRAAAFRHELFFSSWLRNAGMLLLL